MTSQLVAVDIGNTTTSLGLFDSPPPEASTALTPPRHTLELPSGQSLEKIGGWLPADACCWRVASVHRRNERLLADWVRRKRARDEYNRLVSTDLELEIRVEQPEKVGMDRLLAAVAVNHLRPPDRAAIVVDAGSAITVDLVSATGAFEGGVILAGFQMSAEALARKTDLLPLAPFSPEDEPPDVVGKSTVAAIRSGLFWGSVGAIRLIVERMAAMLPQPPMLVVTGGGAQRLAPLLSPPQQAISPPQPRAEPDLVLCGLHLSRPRLAQSPAPTPQ